jgi:hypothetical protein
MLHLSISRNAANEIRVEYIGPDRLAAENAFKAPQPDSVSAEVFTFLEQSRFRRVTPAAAPAATPARKGK